MNFVFEWQEQYLTSDRSERVRYCSCHSNTKFISCHHRVYLLYISRILYIFLLVVCILTRPTGSSKYGTKYTAILHTKTSNQIYVIFTIYGYITNSQCDQLPVGFIAQLVETAPVSQVSWVRVPFRSEFFFRL